MSELEDFLQTLFEGMAENLAEGISEMMGEAMQDMMAEWMLGGQFDEHYRSHHEYPPDGYGGTPQSAPQVPQQTQESILCKWCYGAGTEPGKGYGHNCRVCQGKKKHSVPSRQFASWKLCGWCYGGRLDRNHKDPCRLCRSTGYTFLPLDAKMRTCPTCYGQLTDRQNTSALCPTCRGIGAIPQPITR